MKATDPNYDTTHERDMDREPPTFINKKSRREPIVNMSELARTIEQPKDYAPPAVRNEEGPEIAHIRRKRDEVLADHSETRRAARARLEALDAEGELTEAFLIDKSEEQIAAYKHAIAAMDLATKMFKQLRDDCTALDEKKDTKEEGK